MNWTDGPMIGLDTETTGVDVTSDRIVTVSIGSYTPGDRAASDITWLIAVDIEIDPAATKIHTITTEHAREYGRSAVEVLTEIIDTLTKWWSPDIPLVGYNCAFDLSILDHEARRWLGRPFPLRGPIVDGLVIDKAVDRYRPGSRKLTATCKHYGIDLTEAHASHADTLAAMRLAWKLGRRYPQEVGLVSLAELQDRQAVWFREQQLSFAAYLRGKGSEMVERAREVEAQAEGWPLRVALDTGLT